MTNLNLSQYVANNGEIYGAAKSHPLKQAVEMCYGSLIDINPSGKAVK